MLLSFDLENISLSGVFLPLVGIANRHETEHRPKQGREEGKRMARRGFWCRGAGCGGKRRRQRRCRNWKSGERLHFWNSWELDCVRSGFKPHRVEHYDRLGHLGRQPDLPVRGDPHLEAGSDHLHGLYAGPIPGANPCLGHPERNQPERGAQASCLPPS